MDNSRNYLCRRAGFILGIIASGFILNGCVIRPESAANSATIKAVPSVCQQGVPMVQTTLYFGMNRPQGPVIAPAEWQSFVDSEVTPKFKDGLTVFEAKGQWLGHDGIVAKENSKALMLIHAESKDSDLAVNLLRDKYKAQFSQESVMRIDAPVCVDF
ncbi:MULTISPECIES: DUF3574 domain-containing protein [Yersinia]|uniref:DUF3574 domain-containing protein n=1 Tax=Yersinia TaxID=629 RepID=UPI0007E2F881|nr:MULTISPECIES: DUF3574 domain-containing protein [Yersinia]OWF87256.1 hypothetical protein B4914_12600 [Yersinia entomophaga]